MIYGERVKLAREKLGLNQMQLAVMLETTQKYIANIENCKDDSKKLGWDKMQKIIAMAELPAGYFSYTNDDFRRIVLDNNGIIKSGETSMEEIESALRLIRRLKADGKI